MAGSGMPASSAVQEMRNAFARKAQFLRENPDWAIDYDRENDNYVATRGADDKPITAKQMKTLLDRVQDFIAKEQATP